MQPMASSSSACRAKTRSRCCSTSRAVCWAQGPSRAGLQARDLASLLHFAISLVVATIYILASRRIAVLRTQWVLVGLLYGAAVWAVMNLVVLPLTAVGHSPIPTAALANGLIGHALFVGLPSAFFAKKVEAAA